MSATPQPMSIYHTDAAEPRQHTQRRRVVRPAISEEAYAAAMRRAAEMECFASAKKASETHKHNGSLGGRPKNKGPVQLAAPGIIRNLIFSAGRPVSRAEAMEAAGCNRFIYDKAIGEMRKAGEVEYDTAKRGWRLTSRGRDAT